MIVVQIRGGLGNQFFTYARGFALARQYNCNLILDKYIYDTGYKWDYCLDDYNVSFSKKFLNWIPPRKQIFYNIYKVISRSKRSLFFTQLIEKENYKYNPTILIVNKNYYICGYWQAHEYFDKYRDELKLEFTPKFVRKEILEYAAQMKEACALHIRRGDYATYKGGKMLSVNYYYKAIEIMRNRVKNLKIYVFSDDIDYCKSKIVGIENVVFVEGLHATNIEELYLMSCCKHFIIANSSYSWWAAYLGEIDGSIVIAPVVDQWKDSFYLNTWNTIDSEIVRE